jgi:hypothetical protein
MAGDSLPGLIVRGTFASLGALQSFSKVKLTRLIDDIPSDSFGAVGGFDISEIISINLTPVSPRSSSLIASHSITCQDRSEE